MGTPNLDVALRVKADLDSGRAGVQGLNQDLANTGKAADASNAALGRSSQRMDALLASTAQMVQVLQSVDSRLASFTQNSQQLASTTAQVEAGTAAVVTGLRDMAESEDQVTERIRAVIAASREQIASEQAAAAAASESATSSRERAAAAENIAETIQRQNAQTQRYSAISDSAASSERQAAAAAQDHSAELARLLGQIDPTIAALERLDEQQQQLQRFRSLKLIDEESFQQFQAQIDKSRAAIGSMGVSAGQTAQAMRQLPAQLTDITVSLASGMPVWMVFLQQGGQIKDSFGGVSNALDAVLSKLTPTRIAVGGLAAVLAVLAAGAVAGYREHQQLANSIVVSGNAAGETAGQIEVLAERYGQINGRTGEARDVLNGLAAAGKTGVDAFADVGRAAVNMAAISNKSAQDVVTEWSKIADDPVRGAVELNNQYHFLDTTVFQHIQTLQQAGNQYGALKVLASAFADDTAKKIDELHQHMGWLESFADRWSKGFDALKTQVLDIGKPASEIDKFRDALDKYNKTYDAYQRSLTAGSSKEYQNHLFDLSQKAYQDLLAAQAAAKKEQSDAAAQGTAKEVQSEGIAAAQRIDQLTTSLDRAKQRQDALNKAAEDLYKIHLAGGQLPAGVNFNGPVADMPQGAGWEKIVAEINKRYADPKGPKNDNHEAIAAQQQLIQSLQQLQGELDPTAAAWAKYYQAVERANDEADKAKKDPGANAASIDAQRNAIVALAAAVRDADIQKIADKNREAWEKLLGTLGTPAEVKVGKAVEDIKQLNALMAAGAGNADEYKAALDNIGKNSVLALPSYQGVDGAVGGVTSELSKNFKAQADLDKWHQQALAANEAFRTSDTANEEAYQAGLAQIRSQYAQRSAQIEADRQQLQLTTASNLFGQLATLQQSGNSKIAAVGKAAAISKTLVDTYQSATSAYAAMASIPYVGPALGVAAAAAAIAAGLANVAQIRSQNTSFAGGGQIRGPGTKTSDSIPIWASDGEFMQRAAAVDYYGVDFMHAINNLQLPKQAFADGGYISALADAPRLSAAPGPTPPRLASSNHAPVINNRMRVYYVQNEDELAERLANHPRMEKAVVVYAGQNGKAIQTEWGG